MRLAIVATPSLRGDQRPAPGALDGDVVRARLSGPDTAFEVVDLNPEIDLAEQLDVLLETRRPGPHDPVLFYASSMVALSEQGDFFLCLAPGTGDALGDVVEVLAERAPGPVLVMLECRHAPDPDDPFSSANIVGAGKSAVASGKTGVGLLIAARPLADDSDDVPSAFTRAVIDAVNDADPDEGLTADVAYERIHESESLLGVVPCFARARGRSAFGLVPASPRAARHPAIPPPDDEAEASAPATEPEARTAETDAHEAEPTAPAAELERARVEVAPELEPERDPRSLASVSEPADLGRETEPGEPPSHLTGLAPLPTAVPSHDSSPPVSTFRSAEARDTVPGELPPADRAPVSRSVPPTALPEERSFLRQDPALPKVIVSDRPPPGSVPPARPVSAPPTPSSPTEPSSGPPTAVTSAAEPPTPTAPLAAPEPAPPPTVESHLAAAEAHVAAGDDEAALGELKKALGLLGAAATAERADIYVRVGQAKQRQHKRKEAISNYDKALHLAPEHTPALEALLELSVAERDWRAVQGAEERLLASVAGEDARFRRLVEYGDRWRDVAEDPRRALAAFERARELRPDDVPLLERLQALHAAAGHADEAFTLEQRVAELTSDPHDRAKRYFELGRRCLRERQDEDLARALFDRALEAEPTLLEPLEVIASILAERQEWSDLETAYRKMLDRLERFPKGAVRSEVTWELCRRLGLLFRDHLEDPALALDAFEDALGEKPEDLAGHLTAADLARGLGDHARVAAHLQAVAVLEPARHATYGELFEAFQKARRPDEAYCASSVSMFLKTADTRQRFIFEEHRPDGVPKLRRSIRNEAWELLRPADRDRAVEAILATVAPAAIAARLGQMAAENKLPALDPATRQDPEKSTVSITRSFTWASHFLGIAAPAIYIRDDAALALAAVPAEEASVIAGTGVLRGRGLPDLAFLVGRHLAYYVGSHRLLLYYPSIEELSACFVAAVKLVAPSTAVPREIEPLVSALLPKLDDRLGDEARAELRRAFAAFEAAGKRADLAGWASSVERCATRAGYLLCADLAVVLPLLRADPAGLVSTEAKIADLLGFIVSDAHHTLRQELGIAIQP